MKPAEIRQLLPAVFQQTLTEGNPLPALLEVMAALHEPCEATLQRLAETFDPRRTADPFVPFLARWVDLDWLGMGNGEQRLSPSGGRVPLDLGRLRELVAAAAYLSQWRGTAKGLLLFLQIATGIHGFSIDERVEDDSGVPRPFHIRVHIPPGAAAFGATIARIINSEKPAYVTWEPVYAAQGGGV